MMDHVINGVDFKIFDALSWQRRVCQSNTIMVNWRWRRVHKNFIDVLQISTSDDCWGLHLDAVLSSLQVNATDACSLKNPIYPIYPTFLELKIKFERGEFYSGKVTNQIDAFSLVTYRYRRIFSQDYRCALFSTFSFPGKSSFRALQRCTLVWLFYRGTATITSPHTPF